MTAPANPSAEQWLGLLLVTESARDYEWPAIATVVLNRVRSRRFPGTVEAVILQPSQFSRFRDWRVELAEGGPGAVWDAAMAWLHTRPRPRDLALLPAATDTAARMIAGDVAPPLGPSVIYYYSPRSMVPPHSVPSWWFAEVEREIVLPGIDPNRFRWGAAKRW